MGIRFGLAIKSINGSLSFEDAFSVPVTRVENTVYFILFFEWLIYIHHCPPVNNEGWHAEFHPLGENLLLFFEPLPKNKETVGHQNTVKSLATCEHYWIIESRITFTHSTTFSKTMNSQLFFFWMATNLIWFFFEKI